MTLKFICKHYTHQEKTFTADDGSLSENKLADPLSRLSFEASLNKLKGLVMQDPDNLKKPKSSAAPLKVISDS